MSTKQSKSVRVAPNVTDPTMRSAKDLDEDAIHESVPDENHKTIFGNSSKTKEELEAEQGSADNSQTSTILIIVFALIVIALVALIVWMLMKQTNDQRDEDEMRRVMAAGMAGKQGQPGRPNMQHRGDPAYEAHQRNMAAMHEQQLMMQQQMQQLGAALPVNLPQEKPFSQAMAEKSSKAVVAAQEVQLVSTTEPDTKYSKDTPHPNILKPAVKVDTSDVDDVLAKTQEMLNKKAAKKASDANQDLTDVDRALLDKVHSNEADPDD